MTSRRKFVATTATAALTIAATTKSARAETPKAIPTRTLGRTGLKVPILEVGGTYRFSKRYVQRALELGCTFFDTAAEYVNGWSERTLGPTINALGVRDKVTVVTKGHPKHPESLAVDVQASLERLQFKTIDVYYLHNLSRPAVVTDPAWKAAAEKLKRENKLRFFGFSCHNDQLIPLLKAAAEGGFIDVIMFKYNFRSYDDAELNRAIDIGHKANIGLIAMKTQGSAISFADRVDPFKKAGYSKHQAVLRAVWKDERIASAVSCMPSIQVLEQNAAASYEKLSAVEEELLRHYAEATRRDYCPGGCGGCKRECESATGNKLAIADTLRYLMYFNTYGQRALAQQKFHALDATRRTWTADQLDRAASACPNDLPIASLLNRASELLV